MSDRTDKKNGIRQGIIDSAIIYSSSLAGRNFLYVYGEEHFEVSFPVDHFLHLTGVETELSAKDFYRRIKIFRKGYVTLLRSIFTKKKKNDTYFFCKKAKGETTA